MFSRDKGLECSPICGSACLCLYVQYSKQVRPLWSCEGNNRQVGGIWIHLRRDLSPTVRLQRLLFIVSLFCISSRLKSELKYFMSSKCPQNNNDNNNKKRNVSQEDKQNPHEKCPETCIIMQVSFIHEYLAFYDIDAFLCSSSEEGKVKKTFFHSFTIVSEIPKRTSSAYRFYSWNRNV